MEGVSHEAASFAGPPEALQPLLGLRQQPHHHRRAHLDHLRGRRPDPLRGLPVERHPGRGRQRPRPDRAGFENFREEHEPPDADHRRLPHRLRRARTSRTRPRRTASRSARRRSGRRSASMAGPRTPSSWSPTGSRSTSPTVIGQARRRAAGEWEELFESYRGDEPEGGLHRRRCSAASFPRAGTPTSRASSRREGHGHAEGLEQGRERRRRKGSVAGGGRGRPDRVELRRARGQQALRAGIARGRQFHYGIREHESAAISNGLSLSKMRPVWSTYLTFSDYARPAIRLSALMELPVIHLFTHDSIGLGEDGPTHQPVEQLASLRAIPGLDVIRPADANEVAEAWRAVDGPPSPARGPGPHPPGRPDPGPHEVRLGRRAARAAAMCSPTPRESRR